MKKTGHRKIFYVMASGGHDTDRHYNETIKTHRTVDEARSFLNKNDALILEEEYHGRPFAVWGAIPGVSNNRTWQTMEPGDYVMVYRRGRIILAAEVAYKVRSPQLAKHYWGQDSNSKTWELIYFLINDVEVDVKQSDLNEYLGYAKNYSPQGFMGVKQDKVEKLLSLYGDLLSFLEVIQRGDKPEEIEAEYKKEKEITDIVEDKIGKAPTEHSEMQWRLIRLGRKARFDVWVPRGDQGRSYQGETFRDLVLQDFRESIDVPSYIKNIDTVWKLGLSIKSAFEIENSTSIYSGILRLSDLRSLAPNSNYPLFIVADRSKKSRVFEQLERPTFSNDYLHLNKAVKFLSYDSVRKLDSDLSNSKVGYDINWLMEYAESVQ